ncbi:MAG: dihydrodipicolinate synthase family protein [Verrucomicrobiales bacterium]|nr:dihydrodipicolinate synthase family protein [Verrucomicrobiales bacterium]
MAADWSGLFPALWTPVDGNGQLMGVALADQVRFLRRAGADGLMVLGSTGEFVHLDQRVRRDVLRRVAEAEPGWPVIANCSDVDPAKVADLGRYAREVGASAISLLPPWYFAVAATDVVEFMVRGAEASGLPLLIYNYPERTGHRLAPETIARICDRVQVVGLKQSGAEFGYHRELGQLARTKGFTLITGADTRVAEAFDLGARGAVSGLANAVPELMVAVFRAVQAGNPSGAADQQRALVELAGMLQGLEFAVDVAAMMKARGRETGAFKQVLSPETLQRFDLVVGKLRRRMGELDILG